MILEVIIAGKLVFSDTVDYYAFPQFLVSQMERQWHIYEMQQAGVECSVTVRMGSRMNEKSFQEDDNLLNIAI